MPDPHQQVRNWIKMIANAGSSAQLAELSAKLQDDTIDLIEEQFRRGIGPNGAKLKPKKNPDGKLPLNDTGALAKSFRRGVANSRVCVVTSAKMGEYGKYHQKGRARPWTIRAKPGGVLAFTVGGQQVFAKSVRHPGLPMRPVYPGARLPKRYSDKYVATAKRFWRDMGFRFKL